MVGLKNLLLGKVLPAVLGIGVAVALMIVAHLSVQNANLKASVSKGERNIAELRQSLAEEKARSAEALAQAEKNNRDAERGLQAQAEKDKEKADGKISDLAARAAALSASLRDAKVQLERAKNNTVPPPGGSPATDQVAGGGDIPRVPATIGESDVAEAFRADTIRVELLRCYAAYDRARDLALSQIQP